MKRNITILFFNMLFVLVTTAQITFDEVDVESWVGDGANEAMFILDFDSDPIGVDSTFAWGIQFDSDSISGNEILTLIAQADENFTYEMAGGFLNNINYFSNDLNYTNPNDGWFSILESLDGTLWEWNNGTSDKIADGQWFGIVVMNSETWEAEINVPLLTSVKDISSIVDYKVFPNPASELLYIKITEPSLIYLSNLSGQIVYKGSSEFEKIYISDIESGMYVLTLVTNNSIITEKIIVK